MDLFIFYLLLFGIIVLLGQLFQKSTIPIALILVIAGMLLSLVPFFPEIRLNSQLVLDIFLPLLVYQISSFSSWRDMKKQARPIALLSIGHVFFITILVAVVFHALIPQLGWPLAFVLGAIISPPDDIAIVSIAEKIRIPERIFIILEGEGMFNDAAALTLFRFALLAAITNQFSLMTAATSFFMLIIVELAYGLVLGHLLGMIRVHIKNTSLHVIASFITPFLAYLPAVKFGGSGIIATATVGFIIGNYYTLRFTPEYRLTALTIWPTFAFAIQGLIFLLVGLNLHSIYMRISAIPLSTLTLYITSIIAVIIVGRFIWVYCILIFLPRFLFPSLRKTDPYPPWQYPFLISWAGIRGGISLAAALAIPAFTLKINSIDVRDFLVFIVFCTIFVTLILQGLPLPFIIKKLRLDKVAESERYTEHLTELQARVKMINAALKWLEHYKANVKHDKKASAEVDAYIYEYQMLKQNLQERILNHHDIVLHDEELEIQDKLNLLCNIVTVEKKELLRLWNDKNINLRTRNKLISILDHRLQRNLI